MKDLNGTNNGIPIILQIFSAFMLIGFLFTFLLPETKGKTLEELSQNHESVVIVADSDNSFSLKIIFRKFLNFFRKKPSRPPLQTVVTPNNLMESTRL